MPEPINKLFNNLKSSIIGTKSSQIDKEIDNSLQSIETYSSKVSQNKYIESLRSMIKSTGTGQPGDLLKELQSNNRIEAFEQSGRLQRYQEYEAITAKISYCDRALKVLTDNIISPDDITKRSVLFLKEIDQDEKKKDIDNVISRLKKIEKEIQLEKHIHGIVSKTLKKGDLFVEILHSPKGENAFTILQENAKKVQQLGRGINLKFKRTLPGEEEKDTQIRFVVEAVNLEASGFGGGLTGMPVNNTGLAATPSGATATHYAYDPEPISKDKHKVGGKGNEDQKDDEERFKAKVDKDALNKGTSVKLKDLFISIHKPKYVIRLETERFRTCLGYLIFPKIDPMSINMGTLSPGTNAVDNLCNQVIKHLDKSLKLDQTKDSISSSPELRDVLRKYLKTVVDNDDLKVRYIPPEMMVHWRFNVDKFYPYGESIYEVVSFDARLMMALKVATTIKRLTSATDKRLISIETGLPRDAKNLIEMIREGMRKRKISVDSFGSVDTIPSQISTFEDIYIPMRDGKKFVEFDHAQWGSNAADDIEPLKFMRDNIVANLGVPAPFLGLEENTCFSFNTKIPLLEGFTVEMGRLVEEYEKDPENFNQWTFSVDPETNNIVPGKILKAIRTRKNAQLVRVHLDNGKYEDCTPDHPWMMRDGSYKEAQNLVEDDALMPWYIRKSGIKTRNNTPYMQVYHPGTGRWQDIHRMISEGLGTAKRNDGKQGAELWLLYNPEKTVQDCVSSKEPQYLNHKVSKVEWLEERHDCCDIEVEKYHNFPLESGVFVHNSNRALLSVENILFARTIISYQKELSIPLKELFEKIYILIFPTERNDMDEIRATFQEPKVSPYEHEMEYIEQVTRIMEAHKTLGIPEEYTKKKYLPMYDWEEIEKLHAEENINKELGEVEAGEDGGMGGMGSIGMGSSGF